MNPLEELDKIILQISALQGPTLLIFTLWITGYVMKLLPQRWVPNQVIPLANFGLAIVMTPFLVAWPEPGQQMLGLKYPDASAWIQTIDRGILFWALAWFTHAKFLRKLIDDKLNGLNGKNGNGKDVPVVTGTTPTVASWPNNPSLSKPI